MDSHLEAKHLACLFVKRESRFGLLTGALSAVITSVRDRRARRRYNERRIVNTRPLLSSRFTMHSRLKGPITSSLYGKEEPMQKHPSYSRTLSLLLASESLRRAPFTRYKLKTALSDENCAAKSEMAGERDSEVAVPGSTPLAIYETHQSC